MENDSVALEASRFDVSSSSSESSAEASPSRSARDELDVLLLLLASNVTSLMKATAYIGSASASLRAWQIRPTVRGSLTQYRTHSWHSSLEQSQKCPPENASREGHAIDDLSKVEQRSESHEPGMEASVHSLGRRQSEIENEGSPLPRNSQLTSSSPREHVDDSSPIDQINNGHLGNAEIKGSSTEASKDGFSVREDGYSFFKPGRVFKILWAQPAGDDLKAKVNRSGNSYSDTHKTPIHISLRWMIVVFNKRGYCICCPVSTYRGTGLVERNIPRQEIQSHAIIHTDGTEPQPLPGEPRLSKDPIPVVMAKDQPPLNPVSRVHFGKAHTVEWNVKVMDVGCVKPDFIDKIQYHFMKGFTAEPSK